MGFFAPWFLAGLAALGVPVFVHLLRRHVATPRPVSSLMFYERGVQSSTRHRRLRYLLLFALRCAAIFLVVLLSRIRSSGARQSMSTAIFFLSCLITHSACEPEPASLMQNSRRLSFWRLSLRRRGHRSWFLTDNYRC